MIRCKPLVGYPPPTLYTWMLPLDSGHFLAFFSRLTFLIFPPIKLPYLSLAELFCFCFFCSFCVRFAVCAVPLFVHLCPPRLRLQKSRFTFFQHFPQITGNPSAHPPTPLPIRRLLPPLPLISQETCFHPLVAPPPVWIRFRLVFPPVIPSPMTFSNREGSSAFGACWFLERLCFARHLLYASPSSVFSKGPLFKLEERGPFLNLLPCPGLAVSVFPALLVCDDGK